MLVSIPSQAPTHRNISWFGSHRSAVHPSTWVSMWGYTVPRNALSPVTE